MMTKEQFLLIDELFTYYNNTLFEGKLNDCIIIFKKGKFKGQFASNCWKENASKKGIIIHEIRINQDFLYDYSGWHSTLVHEMMHLWQKDFGKCGARYHNKQWAEKMEEIGLMPSDTGMPSRKKTGRKMTHYILSDGLFFKSFNKLKNKSIKYIPINLPDINDKNSDEKTIKK